MTLLTFQSRIHFASNVLEEALRAELEQSGHRRLVVLCEDRLAQGDFAARVLSGVPTTSDLTVAAIGAGRSKYDTCAEVMERLADADCDGVIAFGSARAIAHGRKIRQTIAKERYAALSVRSRKQRRERSLLPDYYVIPGVDGLPDPCLASGAAAGFKTAPPSVIICDPSLTAGASDVDEARAYATALGRCLLALGCDGFNPLADGLAVEGLRRLVMARSANDCGGDGLRRARDLMAAALNGAIAQQKGVGVVQSVAFALAATTGREIDGGSLQRIMLPRVLREPGVSPGAHDGVIRTVFSLPCERSLSDGIETLLAPLPLARSLHGLALSRDEVQGAARNVEEEGHLPAHVAARLGQILEELY